MGKRREENYSGPEIQLLNTGLSGLYFSAKDLINIGKEAGLSDLPLKSRELILKQLFADSENSDEVKRIIRVKIDARVREYKELLSSYPSSRGTLFPMIQKANHTKSIMI
ncbi:hypothetical protein ThvES_00008920 [Thiovulum sp. ES]|nr:hypothetical protein ThvES_00008920 [Thiovulum sp. ES]